MKEKNKKQLTSGIATGKVKRLLDQHIHMLTSSKCKFYMLRDEGYYYDGDINPQNSDDYVKIGYSLSKKFISRTFNFEIKTVFTNVNFDESFDLSLKFSGFPHIEVTYFKGKGKLDKYAKLYNDPKLLYKLQEIAKKVDIGYIVLSYNKRARKLEIKIAPYAGAVLWILFPPIFQQTPLRQDELKALWAAMMLIRGHTYKLIKY